MQKCRFIREKEMSNAAFATEVKLKKTLKKRNGM